MLKKILVFLLVILIIIQFIHPSRNKSQGEQANNISKIYSVPPGIKTIMDKACADCHSNNTIYPWYSKIQPIDWWMTNHVNEGKRELNFDEFTTYNLRRQYHKLEEVIEQVKEGEMPLNSYTWVHKNAILTSAEKDSIISWAEGIRTAMKNKYPIDSLERKKS
ncbi:MAG: heme-binding domain-containing protein [Chitinophagaceae bacterium]|nr:heme-binding domain-containing protein [Chitinophagaceae bacterium]